MPKAQRLNRIATLTEVRANGVSAGTGVTAAYATRVLNTLENNDNLGITLLSNQFTLTAGTYRIDFNAIVYNGDNSQSRIRNITDSTTVALSVTCSSIPNNSVAAFGNIGTGQFTITSTKTFELQSRVQTSVATVGYGRDSAFDTDNVYAIVKITQLR